MGVAGFDVLPADKSHNFLLRHHRPVSLQSTPPPFPYQPPALPSFLQINILHLRIESISVLCLTSTLL